jgi:uncharacterized membrane protein YkvA (DUF1232 family)
VWTWVGAAIGFALAMYVRFMLVLLVMGRKTDARAWAGFVPDCVVLFTRLARDHRLARRHKWLLAALVGYLALPIDLVPDFIPIAGAMDDAFLVAIVLRTVFRRAGPENRPRALARPAAIPGCHIATRRDLVKKQRAAPLAW